MSDGFLVRHAESAPDFQLAERDWPLSARGRMQAAELAVELAPHAPHRIYASPYVRAVDTVRPLADMLGLAVEIVGDLRERKLSEGPIADHRAVVEQSWRDFDFALPGCESARVAQARAVAAIERLLADNRGRRIVIASHGQLITLWRNARDPAIGFADWCVMKNPHVFEL